MRRDGIPLPHGKWKCMKPRSCPLDDAHIGDELQFRFSCGLGITTDIRGTLLRLGVERIASSARLLRAC